MSEMTAYRLVKRKWLAAAFDGEGARLYGGRWNSQGHSCVYLAGSESLAILEVMVHLDDYSLLRHYALLEVKLPVQQVLHLGYDQLPEDWRDEPAPPSTAEIGDGWLESGKSLALAVPSVVVPREVNFIINPADPLFGEITGKAAWVAFQPDARL